MHITILLIVLAMESVGGQALIRILRDEIDGNIDRTNNLAMFSEATGNATTDGVPYINAPNQWRLPLFNNSGFTTPTFTLDGDTPAVADYAIFAIEIQNDLTENACNRPASQLARISRAMVTVGLVETGESPITVSSYLDAEGNLNLGRMGLSESNTRIRFNFPRMDGDVVQFEIDRTSPSFDSLAPLDVCLQVEFFGVRIPVTGPAPTINSAPLLQYNMFTPSFTYRGNFYDDIGYNGIKRDSYTGGIGMLTDGIVGTNPATSTAQWVGFQTEERAALRLFLNRQYPVLEITVYYWLDIANGSLAPTGGARNIPGQLSQFEFSSISFMNVPGLYTYTALAASPVMLDYIELPLQTIGGGLLITEVEIKDEGLMQVLTTAASITLVPPPVATSFTSFTDVTEVTEVSTSTPGSPPPPPGGSSPLPVDTIIYAVVGVVVCCCASLICIVVSVVLIAGFVFLRKGSKRRHSARDILSSSAMSNSQGHTSLVRRLSDKYLGSQAPSYNKFNTPDTGDYATAEGDNMYQQVDRPLPLPPVPGQKSDLTKEDSYVEIMPTNKPDLTIELKERGLRTMRTFSEDDYMPVTPPSASANSKQPPQRVISATYVAVTPPHSPNKPVTQIKEENYEAVTPPDSNAHLTFQGMTSVPNEYV